MLEKLFLQVINMSYIGSIVIVFILVARIFLKKAPKKYSYILWIIALIRLSVPISLESTLSFVPVNPTPISENILYETTPEISTGVSNIDNSVNKYLPSESAGNSVNTLQIWTLIGTMLWILGMLVLLLKGTLSFIKMKKILKNSKLEKNNIYISNTIDTPFVWGIFKPKIYLPPSLSENEKEYIVLHELTHIKRLDHIIRFISYIILCLHWFNPLVWIGFWLSGKDMEMSCDEFVINKLGNKVKKDYSQSLLNLATRKRNYSITPLAFGEGETKGRIKNILNFKKPFVGIIGLVVVVIIILSIGLLTNPEKIVLPNSNSVETIEMEQFNEGNSLGEIIIYNKDNIKSIISNLEGGRKTIDYSVREYPLEDNYLKVVLNLENKKDTLYLYSKNKKYYIEIPYVGIYKIDKYESAKIYTIYTIKLQEINNNDLVSVRFDISNSNSDDIPQIVKEYALEYVYSKIESYNNADIPISDAKIISLSQVLTGTASEVLDIQMWQLEYRLLPMYSNNIGISDEIELDYGWITEKSNLGKPLILVVHKFGRESEYDIWERIGVTYTGTVEEEYQGNYSEAAVDIYDSYREVNN